MNAGATLLDRRMSVREFLAWEPGDGARWQLVDGEPRAMAPANRTHGAIQAELARLLGNHFASSRAGCFVVAEPGLVPRARGSHNVRIPDLAVTCSGYDLEEATLADPILVIEILSPSNEAATRANVWAYTTIPTLREILLVRTTAIGAELLRRATDGNWPESPEMLAEADTLHLSSIGLDLKLAEAYATTRLARAR